MERFFLYRVYQYNKKLFFFFSIFAALTLFCNLTGFEITPFYVWGMYSQKEEAAKEYRVLKITADGDLIDYSTGYFPANRFFLLSPLSFYESLKTMGDPTEIFLKRKLEQKYEWIKPYSDRVVNSQKEINGFPGWYKRYIEQTTGKKITNLKVEMLFVSCENENLFKVDSAHTLIDE